MGNAETPVTCLLCGDPSAMVKTSKRKNRPYLRCEKCETILFTYSELGAELLKAGGSVSASNPTPPLKSIPPSNPPPLPSNDALITEMKRMKKRLAELEGGNGKPRGALKIKVVGSRQ